MFTIGKNKLFLSLVYLSFITWFFRRDLLQFSEYISHPNVSPITISVDPGSQQFEYCVQSHSDAVRFNKTVIRNLKVGECISFNLPKKGLDSATVYEYATLLPPLHHFLFWLFVGFGLTVRGKKILIPLLAILFLGFTLRWTALSQIIPTGTEPDAHSYLSLAQTISGPLGTQSREPLFILWLQPFIRIGNNPEFMNRISTIFLSLLVVLTAYTIIYQKLGFFSSIFVGVFLAVHPMSVQLSIRGMRDELISLLTLILVYQLFFLINRKLVRYLFIGITMGLLAVSRLETLSFSFLLFLISVVKTKPNLTRIILTVIPIFLMVTPYLAHNKKLYGDYFYPSTLHATWFRNYEFLLVKKTGCNGCPSLADYPRDSSGGVRISSLQYLFSYHSLPEIVSTTFSGLSNLLLLRHNAIVFLGYESYWIHLLYIIGLVALFIKQRWLYIIFPVALVNALTFFLGVDGFLDLRILVNILPFIGLIIYFGIVAVWQISSWVARRFLP